MFFINYPILAEEFIADLRTTIRATLSSAEQCQEENQSERYLVFEIINEIITHSFTPCNLFTPCNFMQSRIIIPNPKNEQLEVYAKQSEEITKRCIVLASHIH